MTRTKLLLFECAKSDRYGAMLVPSCYLMRPTTVAARKKSLFDVLMLWNKRFQFSIWIDRFQFKSTECERI